MNPEVEPSKYDRVLREATCRRELDIVSQNLSRAGLRHLYFKGTALAYSLYSEPHLRTRVDTDLLIDPKDLNATTRYLTELGFTADETSGEGSLSYQRVFIKELTWCHLILDLHWNISNRPAFQNLLPFDEAWGQSLPAPHLSSGARVFSHVHAMMISMIHPFMHHHGERDPIWTRDQLLLARQFKNQDWIQLIEFAQKKKIFRLLRHQLQEIQKRDGLELPDFVNIKLASASPVERTWLYAVFNKSLLGQKLLDLLTNSPRGAWTVLQETIFPNRDYLFKKYNLESSPRTLPLLPFLYFRRAFNGIRKLLR